MSKLALSSLLIVFLPVHAAAQGAVEEARRRFEAGTAAFDTGDYGAAVREFQASYELTRHPDILFNIYSASERDGQYELAASTLERYLAEGSIEAARRPALEQRLARLRARLAQPTGVTGSEAAPIDEPAGRATSPEPPPPAPSPPPPAGVHPAGVALLVAAGVLGLAFGGLAIGSTLESDALASGCGATRTCTGAELATLDALNVAADVSWVTAAAAAAAGIVLMAVLPGEGGEAASARIAPWATPLAAGVVIAGRL